MTSFNEEMDKVAPIVEDFQHQWGQPATLPKEDWQTMDNVDIVFCSSCRKPYRKGKSTCLCKTKAVCLIAVVSSLVTASAIFFALHFKWLLLTK